jgi:anti-anti-sigma factor
MTLTERRVGHVTVLDLEGALTIGDGAGRLKDWIDGLVLQGRTSVVLNLAGIRYVDSEGLGQLVGCYSSLAKTTGSMKLLHVGARTMRLLTITRLVTILETFESEEDAVNSFPELLAVASQERQS